MAAQLREGDGARGCVGGYDSEAPATRRLDDWHNETEGGRARRTAQGCTWRGRVPQPHRHDTMALVQTAKSDGASVQKTGARSRASVWRVVSEFLHDVFRAQSQAVMQSERDDIAESTSTHGGVERDGGAQLRWMVAVLVQAASRGCTARSATQLDRSQKRSLRTGVLTMYLHLERKTWLTLDNTTVLVPWHLHLCARHSRLCEIRAWPCKSPPADFPHSDRSPSNHDPPSTQST